MHLTRFGTRLLLVLVAAGCGSASNRDTDAPTDETDASANDAGATSDDAGSCEQWSQGLTSCDGENLSCEQRDELALDWISTFTECQVDADCRLVTPGSCLSISLCGIAISNDADLVSIESAAEKLGEQQVAAGCGCPIADCAPPVARCVDEVCTVEAAR